MEHKEKLLLILKSIKPHIDYEKEWCLIGDGLFDSFDIVTLVAMLNEEFEVKISIGRLTAENLDSIDAMLKLIESSRKA